MSEEFTLFSPSGKPLRAKLNVTFREAWTIEEQLKETPRHSATRTKIHLVQKRETLSQIASVEYNDPTQWRLIADENNLSNPRLLEPGAPLRIPTVNRGAL